MIMPGLAANAGAGATFAAYDGHRAFFLVQEEGVDRNGDGDTIDTRVLLWTDDTTLPAPVPMAIPGLPGRAGIVLDGGTAARIAPGWIAVVLNETANGLDLNADADQGDNVFMLIQTQVVPSPQIHNTQLVTSAAGTMPLTGVSDTITGVLVRAVETANGNLNGDADVTDTLFVYFTFAAPTTRVILANTGGDHAAVAGGIIGVTANEALNLTDLNGDGDSLDFVFRAFNTTGTVLRAGIVSASSSVPAASDGATWAFLRNEVAESRDLNGDGDMLDLVLGLWRP
jgi:hypothetical protein